MVPMNTANQLPDQCLTALDAYLRPELFKALCDPMRLTIVAFLAVQKQPTTVGELSDQCAIDFSGVSRHLKILKEAEVVAAQKTGREVRYELNCENLTLVLRGLADALEACAASS